MFYKFIILTKLRYLSNYNGIMETFSLIVDIWK